MILEGRNLKIRIEEFEGNTIVLQIISMDERFRGKEELFSNEYIEVSSCGYPSFEIFGGGKKELYLWGTDSGEDYRLITFKLKNKEEKNEFLSNLKIAVDTINKHL